MGGSWIETQWSSIHTTYVDATFCTNECDGGEIIAIGEGSLLDGNIAFRENEDSDEIISASNAEMIFTLTEPLSDKDEKKAGTQITVVADNDGHFNTGTLTAGTYTISCTYTKGDSVYTGSFQVSLDTGCHYYRDDFFILKGKLSVSGAVYDLDTGESMSGVYVSLSQKSGETLSTTTDANGMYSFSNLKIDDYLIRASAEGYDDYSFNFFLDRSQKLQDIELEKIKDHPIEDFFGAYLKSFSGFWLFSKSNSPCGIGYNTFFVDADSPKPLDTMHTISNLNIVTAYEIDKNVLTIQTEASSRKNTLVFVLDTDGNGMDVTSGGSSLGHYVRAEE